MDGFNTFEKQDKVLLGLNSGSDAAAAMRILQQQGFAVQTFTAPLLPAADAEADQSAALAVLPQEVLAKLVLPLGEFTKAEVAEMLAEAAE